MTPLATRGRTWKPTTTDIWQDSVLWLACKYMHCKRPRRAQQVPALRTARSPCVDRSLQMPGCLTSVYKSLGLLSVSQLKSGTCCTLNCTQCMVDLQDSPQYKINSSLSIMLLPNTAAKHATGSKSTPIPGIAALCQMGRASATNLRLDR